MRGVWQTQATALFDVRVIDTDAKSYVNCTPQSILEKAEKEKKSKYLSACEEKHVSFTPLCFSVDGLIGNEAKTFLKRLAERLSEKWHKPYSTIMYWIKAKLNYALIRATVLCVRGSRSKIRSSALLDGASINTTLFTD